MLPTSRELRDNRRIHCFEASRNLAEATTILSRGLTEDDADFDEVLRLLSLATRHARTARSVQISEQAGEFTGEENSEAPASCNVGRMSVHDAHSGAISLLASAITVLAAGSMVRGDSTNYDEALRLTGEAREALRLTRRHDEPDAVSRKA